MRTLIKTISELEYLEQEALATSKSEYHNGEILNMVGASEAHNLVLSNLLGELYICLKGKNCKIYPSDMLLKLEQCKKYVYPDVMIDSTKTEAVSYTCTSNGDWLLDVVQELSENILIGECIITLADLYARVSLEGG